MTNIPSIHSLWGTADYIPGRLLETYWQLRFPGSPPTVGVVGVGSPLGLQQQEQHATNEPPCVLSKSHAAEAYSSLTWVTSPFLQARVTLNN